MKSNICFVSNVYPCKEDYVNDSEFLKVVRDYDKLKNMKDAKYSSAFPAFSYQQQQIILQGNRCKFNQDDPCWGIIKKDNKEFWRNRCMKTECKRFLECRGKDNPYHDSEKIFLQDINDTRRYGNPKKQPVYFLINARKVKSEKSYYSNLVSETKHYAIKKEEKKITKGKVIGYRKQRFSDYCDEQYAPIYEEEIEQKKNQILRKYGSSGFNLGKYLSKKEKENIQKLIKERKIENDPLEDIEKSIRRENYQETKKRKQSQIDSKEFSKNILKLSNEGLEKYINNPVCLVLKDEMQMQYLASHFMKKDIPFSIDANDEKIVLSYFEDTYIPKCECIVMDSILDDSKTPFWKKQRGFIEGRSNVAYVILDELDFQLNDDLNDISCEIECYKYIVNESITYEVKTMENLCIGTMTRKFIDDISEYAPSVITGVRLKRTNGTLMVQGIGHMEYDEY